MEPSVTQEMVDSAAQVVRPRLKVLPRVALILGSGLNHLADEILDPVAIPYAEIPHFVPSTVPGHAGRFVGGMLSGVPVLAMQGRVHFYEGYSAAQITLPVRVMKALGASVLVVTNAAGGLRPDFVAGDLMAITDHVYMPGLAGNNPLRGPNDERLGVRFPDMTPAYDPALLDLLRQAARDAGESLFEGVYAMVAGPSYETPAEIRFLRAVGVDAVGMSTAPEVVVARHSGMRVLGISLITNVPADFVGDSGPADAMHKQVLAVGEDAVPRMTRLVRGVLERIGAAGEA
ncbi:MAG: purine-nucleoside phosphorylase [Anaerolineae bacterium]